MLDCHPIDTPMDSNVKLLPGQGGPMKDSGRYGRLVERLNYLIVTRPSITFTVSIVRQFLNASYDSHWDVAIQILKYIKNAPEREGLLYEDYKGDAKIICYLGEDWAGSPSDRRSTSRYCVLIRCNMISWRNKKQNNVALSSAEA